jgi:hypothetical protein
VSRNDQKTAIGRVVFACENKSCLNRDIYLDQQPCPVCGVDLDKLGCVPIVPGPATPARERTQDPLSDRLYPACVQCKKQGFQSVCLVCVSAHAVDTDWRKTPDGFTSELFYQVADDIEKLVLERWPDMRWEPVKHLVCRILYVLTHKYNLAPLQVIVQSAGPLSPDAIADAALDTLRGWLDVPAGWMDAVRPVLAHRFGEMGSKHTTDGPRAETRGAA